LIDHPEFSAKSLLFPVLAANTPDTATKTGQVADRTACFPVIAANIAK
jgi:hypothetical protein